METSGPIPRTQIVKSDEDVLRVNIVVDVVTVPGFNASSYASSGVELQVGNVTQSGSSIANNASVIFDFDREIKAFRTRGYNNGIPGPTIEVWPGQRLELTLINRLGHDNEYMNCCSESALQTMEAGGIKNGVPQNPFNCYPGMYTDYWQGAGSYMTGAECCNNCTMGPTPGRMNYDWYGPNTTNFHTHGLHTSPLLEDHGDSAPFIEVFGGVNYTYVFDVPPDHWTGTLMYHAHKHGSTGFQVGGGLFGALIVRDPPGRGPPAWLPDIYSEVEEEIVVLGTQTPASLMWMGTLMNETVRDGVRSILLFYVHCSCMCMCEHSSQSVSVSLRRFTF